jgi:two-component system, NtrC family, response regulator GlrR
MMNPSDPHQKKILIVDDEQPICDMLQKALERGGYTVFTANCAEDALAIMKLEQCPVMLIDFVLPETDGISLYKQIKSEHPESLAYLLTGYVSEEDLLASYAAGFKHYFLKPVSLQALSDYLQESFLHR